jgi:hypothetical protein
MAYLLKRLEVTGIIDDSVSIHRNIV